MNRRDVLKAIAALAPVKSIEVAALRPEDVIVIECDHLLEAREVENIRETSGRVWPGRKIVVLDGGLHMRITRGLTTVR